MDASQSALVSPKGWAPSSPQRQNCHNQEKAPSAPATLGTHPASPSAEANQPGAKAQWLDPMPLCTGQGRNQEEMGIFQAGSGSAEGWGDFATSGLGESLGMAVLRRNALSSPGHRGKRRCLIAEEKLMGGKSMGKR